jgi:molecular chaperone GrpE
MSDGSDDELMAPKIGHGENVADVDDDVDDVIGVDDATEVDDVAEVAEVDEVDDLAEEIDELEAVTQERDQFKDIALRLQADFENYRKRMAAQSADAVDRATGRLAEALLPVLDAAEAAFVQHPDEVGPLLNAMLTELKKHGLETLDLEGQPFDPAVAEAVTHESGEGGDVVVSEVMRSGYRWKGRTLRPAMVRTRD